MSDRPRYVVATGAMAGFTCLGGACDDTCCQGWSITIDEAHFRALATRMVAPVERARFDAAFDVLPGGTPAAWAKIRLADGARCPLLDGEGLCSVHRDYGEPALPDVCAAFPRLGRIVDDRYEIHGALSCPEVARRTLFAVDGPALVEIDGRDVGRVPLVDVATGADAALLDELRGGLAMILDDDGLAPAARLLAASWLADEAGADDAEDAGDLALVAEAIDLAGVPELREALVEELDASSLDDDAVEVLFAHVARLRSVVRPGFAAAIDGVMAGYADEGAVVRVEAGWRRCAPLAAAWARRRDAFPVEKASALDLRLLRLARAHVLRDVAADRRALPSRMRELVVRLATLRFLVLSGGGDDAWLVKCVYETARLVDHGRDLARALFDGTEELLPTAFDLAGLLKLAFG